MATPQKNDISWTPVQFSESQFWEIQKMSSQYRPQNLDFSAHDLIFRLFQGWGKIQEIGRDVPRSQLGAPYGESLYRPIFCGYLWVF